MNKIYKNFREIYSLDMKTEIDESEIASMNWLKLLLSLLGLTFISMLMIIWSISAIAILIHEPTLFAVIASIFPTGISLFFIFIYPIFIQQMRRKYLHQVRRKPNNDIHMVL